MDIDKYAVHIVNASKSYGHNEILQDLCMAVPKGAIYGLLGPSGCGKTTLLSCIVGRKKLTSGDITVLGSKPASNGNRVLGPRLGYMPQELELMGEFTIEETIFYFGRILAMKDDIIEERFEELEELLDLPPKNRQLKNCSGGQQRRVSLAAAIIHKPELLILDEPTVGLDPELRASIWTYLLKTATELKTAIIITTHYIEEARHAHRIGLMRGGKLLAEGSPEKLLQVFNAENLEEVFLTLSKQQETGELNHLQLDSCPSETRVFPIPSKQERKCPVTTLSFNKQRTKALFLKNLIHIIRNPSVLVIVLALPPLIVFLCLLCVGPDPKRLPIAVVNDESANNCENYSKIGTAILHPSFDCTFANLGCRFMDELKDPMLDVVVYDDIEHAFNDMQHRIVVGVFSIAHNFSEAFSNRINDGQVSDDDLNFGEIKIWLDQSDYEIATILQMRIFNLFRSFIVSSLTDCDYSEKLATVPIRFHYEYGSEEEPFTNFIIPGLLMTTAFFQATVLACTIIIADRIEGVWDRSIVAGVSVSETISVHFITHFLLVFLQSTEMIIVTFGLCGTDYVGDIWLVSSMVLIQGISGMITGFLISIFADSYELATILSTGIFNGMIYLCGLLWPLEAQSNVLRYFSRCLPFTLPIAALRQVIGKGYGLDNVEVLSGFGVMLIWLVILILLNIYTLKGKR